jgi:hypothetical protein
MKKRSKTVTFTYRHFDVGEKVKAGADFGSGSDIRPGRVYTVKKCTAPEESCYDSLIEVEEVEGDRPSWYFDPLSKTRWRRFFSSRKRLER